MIFLAQNTNRTTFSAFKEVSHVLASMLSVNNLNPTVAQGFSVGAFPTNNDLGRWE